MSTWRIVIGWGNEPGVVEPYTGKVSLRAMRARLSRARRCGRWAYFLRPDGARVSWLGLG
jgi:hypothetical protein